MRFGAALVRWISTACIACALLAPAVYGEDKADLLSEIDKLAAMGDQAPQSLAKQIAEEIERDPASACALLLPKAQEAGLSDQAAIAYVWALALTKDPRAVDVIIGLKKGRDSAQLTVSALRGLGAIGGPKAGDFVFAQLEVTADPETRFEIFNLLGQMHYAAALPSTNEILKKDRKELYWQPIFVFGKMGDAAVPFLLGKVDDDDLNVRANAIMILGQWLIPPEAVPALQARFWTENDPEVRALILSSLEKTTADPAEVNHFAQQVVAKEQDPKVRQFAAETLANAKKMKDAVRSFTAAKTADRSRFDSEYAKAFTSFGIESDWQALAATSSVQDEARLKALREQILQRNSDEAFSDYNKVNDIIMFNRFKGGTSGSKRKPTPSH